MLGQTLDQRYEVVSQIGSGGLADVFLGRDLKLGRLVAIKVLRSEKVTPVTLARLRSEVELQAQLDHPAIVRVYDVGTGAAPYLVMEFVDGANFETVLRRMSLASLPRRLSAVIQVLHGLEALHTRKFLHRDLKPSNILISRDGIAKLADFGLCRWLEQDAALTREGSTVGTVLYISPEQATGKPVDHHADLYALGVILYQCCTDRVPFRGPAIEVIAQHVHANPEPPRTVNPQVPTELESLVLRLLEKTADRRPASAAAVRLELERILGKYWPDLTEASMRTALGAKARTRDEQSVSLSDENYRTRDGDNDTLEIPAGASRKCPTQSLPDELPELKLVDEASAKTGKPIDSPKVQATAAPRKPSAEQADTSTSGVSERKTKVANKTQRKSPAAQQVKGSRTDEEEFENLPQSTAYAPVLRRKTAKKSKSKSSSGVAKIILTCVAGTAVTIGAVWGISTLLHDGQSRAGNEPSTTPVTSQPTAQTQQPPETPSPGQVRFSSKIKGARLLVNGELRGTTPLKASLELQPGQHKLEMKFGKLTLTQQVELKNGATWDWPAVMDFSEDQIVETGRGSVCLLKGPKGHGSGFLVDDQQTIVTAAHVINDVRNLDDLEFIFSPSADKRYPNEEEFKRQGAKLIHLDRTTDVAIFFLNDPVPEDRPPLQLLEEKVQLQTAVFAIGNPGWGQTRYLPLQVAHGVVASDNPLLVVNDPKFSTGFVIKEGYSGGPVIAKQSGDVIGIVSERWSFTLPSQNAVFTQTALSPVFLVRKALKVWGDVKGDEEAKTTHLATIRSNHQVGVSNSRVLNAGLYLAVMSSLYFDIAMKTSQYWKDEMEPLIRQLEAQYRQGGINAKTAKERALKEALATKGILVDAEIEKLRTQLRKGFNEQLVKMTEEWYGEAAKDEEIDVDTRKKLEVAYQHFVQLQKDATKLKGDVELFRSQVEATKKSADDILKPLLEEKAKQLELENYSYPTFEFKSE